MSRRSSPGGAPRLFRVDGTLSETLVKALAELIASAILVFVGCTGCVGSLGTPAPRLQIAMTFGFAIASLVHILGHISHCHINPMVSLCATILGLKSVTTAVFNITAHFLGAIIGYGMLKVVTPAELLHTGDPKTLGSFCVTMVNEKISPIQGLFIETMASGILILFVCACMDPRNKKPSDAKAIKFGLLISGLVMAFGPYTSCSMNPARSFAPALWNNKWNDNWIYWVGPVGGTILASLTYKTIFWPTKTRKEDIIAEAAALNPVDIEKSELK